MSLLQRLEAFVERMAKQPYCDTKDYSEARELWALIRGESK